MASPVTRSLTTRFGFAALRKAAFWSMVGALAIAAVCFFAGSLAWTHRPYPGFKLRLDRQVELQLPPSSTGAKAGLMPGDRVLAVDGKPLDDPRTLYAYVASKPLGTPITYRIERFLPNGGQRRLTKVIATQLHDWKLWATIFLALWLTGLSFLALGTTVSLLKPGDPLARANLAFHLAGAAACIAIFDQSTTFLSPFQDPCKLLQWFIAMAFLNLALQFPRRYPALEAVRRANLVFGLVFAALLVAAYATGRFTFWVTFGHLPYIALGEVVLLGNALWTALSARSTPQEKGQGKVVLAATLLSTVPALLVPQAHFLGVQVNLEGMENFTLPLWPLAISYAIVRYHLFDIHPIVKRSITYLVSAVLLTLLYVVSAAGIEALIGSHTQFPGIVATILVVLAFAPVRDRVKRWLDARFFRSPYRFDEVIAGFTRTAQENVEPQVLMQAYLDAIDRALAPTRCALFMRQDGLRPAAWLGFSEAECAAIAASLETGAPPSWRGESLRVLPLVVQDRQLGAAVVGPKKSELAYTELDQRLLGELTQSLAVWLDLFERFEKARAQTQEIEALKRSEALQGQFLNMVSHELKIPLSVMLGSLNLLERDADSLESKTVSHLKRMRRSVTHLNGLVGDLLNAGQLQSGHFRLRTRPLALAAVAAETVSEMRPLAEQKQQSLALDVSEDLPAIDGDGTRLEQVFRNLLHNAIRYTPDSGCIQLVLARDGEHIRCEVRDDGPGIAAEALPRLFQRFSQVHEAAPARDQGVGLGLFIAKAIVEAHGGQIGVQSAPGEGSTFWFTLPACDEPPTASC
ncbi:MAG TPA: ATP-binding protein [Oscillatoriaceae cyanobacterium]